MSQIEAKSGKGDDGWLEHASLTTRLTRVPHVRRLSKRRERLFRGKIRKERKERSELKVESSRVSSMDVLRCVEGIRRAYLVQMQCNNPDVRGNNGMFQRQSIKQSKSSHSLRHLPSSLGRVRMYEYEQVTVPFAQK